MRMNTKYFLICSLFVIVSGSVQAAQDSRPAGSFKLPNSAKIIIQALGQDEAASSPATDCKSELKVGVEDVRKFFATYKRVNAQEVHDHYAWFGCFAKGVVGIGSKSYTWKWRLGNLLETTYPDGKPKTLGGEYSDDLAK